MLEALIVFIQTTYNASFLSYNIMLLLRTPTQALKLLTTREVYLLTAAVD